MGTRIDRRFDYLRKQTEQDSERQGQEQTDALQRQAASRGRLGSGSYQKVQMQANEALQKQKQNAIEGVESQREAALAQKEEADVNRQFARDERLGSQEFAMASQRQSEGFQEGMWNKQEEVRRKESHDAAWQAQQNFKVQMKMADAQFAEDQKVNAFNMKIAAKLANAKGDDGGFLGDFGKFIMGGGAAGAAGNTVKGMFS